MRTIHVDTAELALLRSALHSYMMTFGHDEADVVAQARRLLHKIDTAPDDDAATVST